MTYEHWTAVLPLLGLISSARRDLHHWKQNQQQQYAEVEALPLGHRLMSHINDTKLTSHGDNASPLDLMCLEGTYSLQRTRPPPGLRLSKSVLWIHITLISWAGNRIILYLNGWINVILELSSLENPANTYMWHRVSTSAYYGCWFDLQLWRSRCAQLMRPNKVETAVQCSVCHMKVLVGFSIHDNSISLNVWNEVCL